MDEMTLTLNSPLTEEQWDAIMDVDLENTPRIMFHTKHGQEVWYEKRKTGRWIRHDEVRNVYGGTYVECSECGEKYVVQHVEDEKYCRNCGAKMEAGDD